MLFSPIRLTPATRELEDLPQLQLRRMAVKLYLLSSLTWDYTDTILKLAANMRIAHTRPLCRAVRELRAEHDRLYSLLDAESEAQVKALGEMFEDVCHEHLTKLCYGLRNEIMAVAECSSDYLYFVQAVQMAMTLLDTLRLYAGHFDDYLHRNGVHKVSVLSSLFDRLAILLPEFAIECFNTPSPTRRLTSRILFNELLKTDLDYNDESHPA